MIIYRMRQFLLTSIVALSLTGCAQNVRELSSFEVEGLVNIQGDEFEDTYTFLGPELTETTYLGLLRGYEYVHYRLRGWKQKDGNLVGHQFLMRVRYDGDWRFYERGRRLGGRGKTLTVIGRDVIACQAFGRITTCTFEETVGLDIPDETLRRFGQPELKIKISARRGRDLILSIPGNYIEGYLMSMSRFN